MNARSVMMSTMYMGTLVMAVHVLALFRSDLQRDEMTSTRFTYALLTTQSVLIFFWGLLFWTTFCSRVVCRRGPETIFIALTVQGGPSNGCLRRDGPQLVYASSSIWIPPKVSTNIWKLTPRRSYYGTCAYATLAM